MVADLLGRVKRLLPWVAGAAVIGLAIWLYTVFIRQRDQLLELQNRAALADTTRVIFKEFGKLVTERLAEQRDGLVHVEGLLGKLMAANKEQGAAIIRIRLAFDSVIATTSGRVRTDPNDPTMRILTADLDTAGIHAGIVAAVPPPPREAIVNWSHWLDTTEVLQTLSRTATGQAVFRAETEGRAKVIADSVVFERERSAPRFLGLRLPDFGGAVIVAIPALLVGVLAGLGLN